MSARVGDRTDTNITRGECTVDDRARTDVNLTPGEDAAGEDAPGEDAAGDTATPADPRGSTGAAGHVRVERQAVASTCANSVAS